MLGRPTSRSVRSHLLQTLDLDFRKIFQDDPDVEKVNEAWHVTRTLISDYVHIEMDMIRSPLYFDVQERMKT